MSNLQADDGELKRSSLLSRLGVKSAVVVEHGPSGRKCGIALSAALAMAMCGASGAAASTFDHTTTPTANYKSGSVHGEQSLGDTVVRIATQPTGKLITGSADGPETIGEHAIDLASTALSVATVANPYMATIMVFSQARDSYLFVQERQEIQLKEKLAQVAERVAKVQADEVVRIRLDERERRGSLPLQDRLADHARMVAQVRAVADYQTPTKEFEGRLETEKMAAANGLPTEDWYAAYQELQKVEINPNADDTSQPSRQDVFAAALGRLNTAQVKRLVADANDPTISAPGLR